MRTFLRPAIVVFVLLTALTGILYPLAVTGIAQLIFPYQANGSLIVHNGVAQGSELIGQQFNDPRYFWGRLSATSPYPYNAAASAGSNLGPGNPALVTTVETRIAALRASDPQNSQPIPVDLVTASGSGLDPEISLAAVQYQVRRVAATRGVGQDVINALVAKYTEDRQYGILGEPRVNVLQLNLALDALQ